jgi:hypothetical protein
MLQLRAGLCLMVLLGSNAWAEKIAAPFPDFDQRFAELDHRLFDLAYNGCDVEAMRDLVSEDLEFYHDVGGVTLGREDFMESFTANICGPDYHVTRTLVEGTLVNHALHENGRLYGVVQSGEHLFSIVRPGQEPQLTGHAAFTTLWRLEGWRWRMSRVLSYDHEAIEDWQARQAEQEAQ